MTPDPQLVEELAQAMRDQNTVQAWDLNRALGPNSVPFGHFAAVALSWLAEHGRLVPDGATVEERWNISFHPAGSPPGYRRITWDTASSDREDAETYLRDWADCQPELVRCEIHTYPDGSYLTTPWEPVLPTQENTDA